MKGGPKVTQEQIYQNIAQRTGGDIYIGVVGPVRTGKSTLIKRFAELMLLPHIKNDAQRARATDELPQSAAGRTIMTTEPNLSPKRRWRWSFRAGAVSAPGWWTAWAIWWTGPSATRRTTPRAWSKAPGSTTLCLLTWLPRPAPARSSGNTPPWGLVVTTDGSIAEIPRERYLDAEQRIIAELDDIGKPYLILLNCVDPDSEASRSLAAGLERDYGRPVIPVSCTQLTAEKLDAILKQLLYEFPVQEIAVNMPAWVTMLEPGHWLQSSVYGALQQYAAGIQRMRDVAGQTPAIDCEYLTGASLCGMDLATGSVRITLRIAPDIFYKILGEQTGLDIVDEATLLPCVVSLARAKRAYDKIKGALDQVEATGYGIVMPDIDELALEEPEIVRQGGQYGVRLSASAPSLHIMRATIHTEISPSVGSEQQGEELIKSILQDFESDPGKLWNTNIFGKSLNELVNEGVQAKLLHMPQEARSRLQVTLERIINDGCDGLICILL